MLSPINPLLISDTINYKQVMSEYRLGPNGAIMTSLNLLCTRLNQVGSIFFSATSIHITHPSLPR